MKKEEDILVNDLMEAFINFRKLQLNNIFCNHELSYNENYILYILNSGNTDIHLSIIRDKLKLAPSSITSIVTGLEDKGYIVRIIDKEDRRNIYIKITYKGKEYLNNIHNNFINNIEGYIKYMSREDINEIIRLMSKTSEYIKEVRK